MAKPKVFVSSTYYDLKHIRKSLESFIDDMGYTPVLFESGEIGFDPQVALDKSCYKELKGCQIFVLIIGGRYGSAVSDESSKKSRKKLEDHYDDFTSITRKEYEEARDRDIPIYVFIEKSVFAEFSTFKKYKGKNKVDYSHVYN